MCSLRMLLIFMLSGAGLSAQSPTVVSGSIEDQTKALIPGARVVLSVESLNFKAETVTGDSGTYRFEKVPPGKATVTAGKEGFNTVQKSVDTMAGGPFDLHFTLVASTVVQKVRVSASAQMLQTDRSAQAGTLNTQQIQSLPTASRNYTHLIVAEAGVAAPLPDRTGRGINLATAPGSESDDGTQSINPSVNGARPTNNSLSINGVDATNMMNGAGSLGSNINVPLDALEAVEMQTALYSASTGRNGGANIQMGVAILERRPTGVKSVS